MKKLRIASIGAWQAHARDFAKKIQNYPQSWLAAVYDEDEAVARAWAEEMGCECETDLEHLLSREDIDGVIVTSGTVQHAQQILAAIRHHKHVFVEKPAFAAEEEGVAVQELLKTHDVKFMMSDPMVTPPLVLAKQMMKDGTLGQVTMVRVRSAHGHARDESQPAGVYHVEESGGGSMFDMGCHCCHMLEYLLGKPRKAHASFSQITPVAQKYGVDDNALCVYEYDNGIIATAETGWTSDWYQNGFMVFGTKGCIIYQDSEFRYHVDGGEWITVPQAQLPAPRTYPMEYWLNSILEDTPIRREHALEATTLTCMITAAYRSQGKAEPV